MLDIINKVKELYESLLVREKKYNEEFDELKNKRVKIDSDAKANESLTTELEEREKKVKSIEDVVKLKDEVATSYRSLTSDKKILSKDKGEFEECKTKAKEEIKTDKEDVSARRQKLKKQELDLGELKKSYKEEVMANINKTLKSKGIEI